MTAPDRDQPASKPSSRAASSPWRAVQPRKGTGPTAQRVVLDLPAEVIGEGVAGDSRCARPSAGRWLDRLTLMSGAPLDEDIRAGTGAAPGRARDAPRRHPPPLRRGRVGLTWASGVPHRPPRRRGRPPRFLTPRFRGDSRALHAIGAPAPGEDLHDRHSLSASSGTAGPWLYQVEEPGRHGLHAHRAGRDERLAARGRVLRRTRPRRGRADRHGRHGAQQGRRRFFAGAAGLYTEQDNRQPTASSPMPSTPKAARSRCRSCTPGAKTPIRPIAWAPRRSSRRSRPSPPKELDEEGIEKADRRHGHRGHARPRGRV